MSRAGNKLYIAKFGNNVGRRELEETFSKYGDVYSCNVNERGGYATVTYKHDDQAEKAIQKLNGANVLGGNLLVEHTLKKSRDEGYSRPPRGDRYGGDGYRDQNGSRSSRYGDRGSDRDRGSSYRSNTRGPPRDGDKDKFFKDGLCFNCGQHGHISRKCPEQRQGDRRGPGFRGGDRERGRPYRERSRSHERKSRREQRSRSPNDKYDGRDKDRKRSSKKHSHRSSSSSSSNRSNSKSRRHKKRSNSSKSSRSNTNTSRSASSRSHKKSNGDKHQNGNPHDQKKETFSSQ